MNIWVVALSLFSVLGLILSIVFYLKKGIYNKLFALLMFMFAYNVFFNIIYWTQMGTKFYAFFHMSYLVPLSLYGGLFYLYLKSITGKRIVTKDVVHFIPVAMTMVLYSGYYFLKPSIKYQVFLERKAIDYVIYIPYFGTILVALLLGYAIFAYFRFRHAFKDDIELKKWTQYILWAFVGFALSFVAYEVMVFTHVLKIEHDYMITVMSVLFIGIVAYMVNVYPAIFNGKSIREVIPFVKYQKTGLHKKDGIALKEKLVQIMEKDKPYLNCDLRLMHIANMLEVPRHHASQIINEYFQASFFDFVNQYRVIESEKLLTSQAEHYTMESIAYQSGFNNKVSFYRAFKKFNGLTPTAFKEQYT